MCVAVTVEAMMLASDGQWSVRCAMLVMVMVKARCTPSSVSGSFDACELAPPRHRTPSTYFASRNSQFRSILRAGRTSHDGAIDQRHAG
jgi:hypothetical protein